jgi:hypothetical protein
MLRISHRHGSGCGGPGRAQADDNDIRAIQRACDELERVVEPQQGIGAKDDFEFHLAVARASKNQFFISVLSFMEAQVVFSMNLSRNLIAGEDARTATGRAVSIGTFWMRFALRILPVQERQLKRFWRTRSRGCWQSVIV